MPELLEIRQLKAGLFPASTSALTFKQVSTEIVLSFFTRTLYCYLPSETQNTIRGQVDSFVKLSSCPQQMFEMSCFCANTLH